MYIYLYIYIYIYIDIYIYRQSVRWKAWWRQSNIKCALSEECASCYVHQDCHVADQVKAA